MAMAGPPPSVYLVLCAGNGGGGLVKGVTGFGSAIINLLVWVASTAVGINGGTLQQAVLTECVSCLVVGIPLLIMTKAHKTADWRLVMSILIFTAVGAPIGAALLQHLDACTVELVMALVLTLVIIIHIKLPQHAHELLKAWRDKPRKATSYVPLDDECQKKQDAAALIAIAVDVPTSPVPSQRPSLCGSANKKQDAVRPFGLLAAMSSLGRSSWPRPQDPNNAGGLVATLSASIPGRSAANVWGVDAGAALAKGENGSDNVNIAPNPNGLVRPASVEPAGPEDHSAASTSGPFFDHAPQVPLPTPDTTYHNLEANGQEQPVATMHPPLQSEHTIKAIGSTTQPSPHECAPAVAAASDAIPLLSLTEGGSSASPQGAHADSATKATDAEAAQWAEGSARVWGGWGGSDWRHPNWREISRIFTYGSIAATASGIMGGMTGMGGPPMMYMFDKLVVPKEVVRGTNAVGNVFQMRLITYIVMHVFKAEDVYLYAGSSMAALLGTLAGNAVAGRLDQRGFSKVLVALMVVCCILLYASAAGLAGRK